MTIDLGRKVAPFHIEAGFSLSPILVLHRLLHRHSTLLETSIVILNTIQEPRREPFARFKTSALRASDMWLASLCDSVTARLPL
jgi:hypothetical protein